MRIDAERTHPLEPTDGARPRCSCQNGWRVLNGVRSICLHCRTPYGEWLPVGTIEVSGPVGQATNHEVEDNRRVRKEARS